MAHPDNFAPPRDVGRKRGIAEVDGQPTIAEGDAPDPTETSLGGMAAIFHELLNERPTKV